MFDKKQTGVREMAYKTIPVDEETYEMVQKLCAAYEMNKRAQGALVKKLVKADYNKLAAAKLIPETDSPKPGQNCTI